MREIYTKTQDDAVAKIEINFEVQEYKSESPWLLSLFVKYDSFDENQEGYEEFLETKEALIIALEHQKKVHYLGSRVVDGWSELYFCAEDSKGLEGVVKTILSSSNYAYESNVVRDSKWDVYETQLFPNELELAHIQSMKIITLLKEEGDDLSLPREVEHYVVFDTPTQKERFINSKELTQEGFVFKDEISSEEYEHGVALSKVHSVDEVTLQKTVAQIYEELKKHGGYYEGWSTTLAGGEES